MDDISNLKRKYIVLKVKKPNEYIDREPHVVKNVRWSQDPNTTDHLFAYPTVRWIVPLRN